MTFQNLLNEEFVDYKKPSYDQKHAYGIWKNPTRKELEKLQKEEHPLGYLFLADEENNNVYVFNFKLRHDEVKNKLKSLGVNTTKLYHGFANGKLEVSKPLLYGKNRDEKQKEMIKLIEKKTPFRIKK